MFKRVHQDIRNRKSLLDVWIDQNTPSKSTLLDIERAGYISRLSLTTRVVSGNFVDWYVEGHTGRMPDLTEAIGSYGLSRMLYGLMEELPFGNLSHQEAAIWRKNRKPLTRDEDVWGLIAGASGALLWYLGSTVTTGDIDEVTAADPERSRLVGKELPKQVKNQLEKLRNLVNSNSPEFRKRYTVEEVQDPTDQDSDEWSELDWPSDIRNKRILEVFELCDLLEGLAYGLQILQTKAMDKNPEFNTPLPALYRAFIAVDINEIYRTLEECKPSIVKIQQLLVNQSFTEFVDDAMPDAFWWRRLPKTSKKL